MSKKINYTHLDDVDVLRLFLNNKDERAYKTLYNRYYKPLYKFILWHSNNSELAQEVAQETLIKLYQKPNLFNAKSTFKTWLYTIAKNTFKNTIRKNYNEQQLKNTLHIAASQEDEGDDEIRNTRLKLIQLALEKLPEKQKEAFVLKYSCNLTISEISEVCDCSVGTIKSRLFKATHGIKNRLSVKHQ